MPSTSSSSSSFSLSSASSSSTGVSSSSSFSSSSSSSSTEIKSQYLDFTVRGIEWSLSKPLASALPGTDFDSAANRLAQTLVLQETAYDVPRVACYLGARTGSGPDYDLTMELYETSSEGFPLTLVQTATVAASTITKDGWIFFDFNVHAEQAVPSNRMLSFVLYQNGGSEDDYVTWFYTPRQGTLAMPREIALTSLNGGVSWQEQRDAVRALKVFRSGATDLFANAYEDTPAHRIQTNPGRPAQTTLQGETYLDQGQFDHTQVRTPDDDPARAEVALQQNKLWLSVVLDSSGSAGWNDRSNQRTALVRHALDYLRSNFPQADENLLVDVVHFGSYEVGAFSFDSSQAVAQVNLYLHQAQATEINADGSTPRLADGVIAYGFSDLEPGHRYTLARIRIGQIEIEDGDGVLDGITQTRLPLNVRSLGPAGAGQAITFQIASEGPDERGLSNQPALVFQTPGGSGNATRWRRRLGAQRALEVQGLSTDVDPSGNPDETVVPVADSSPFTVGGFVDLVDHTHTSPGHQITEVLESPDQIRVTPALPSPFGAASGDEGGFVQDALPSAVLQLGAQSGLSILLKDPNASRPVTFYLETAKGGKLKWTVSAFLEWQSAYLFYTDETAVLSITGKDSLGNPLTSGTEVRLFVDAVPEAIRKLQTASFTTSQDQNIATIPRSDGTPTPLPAGADIVPLASLQGVSKGDSAILVGADNQTDGGYLVTEVSADPNQPYLRIFPPNNADFEVIGVRTAPPVKTSLQRRGDAASITISAIDVTQPYAGREIDPGLLRPYDPISRVPPMVPTDANLDPFNQDAAKRLDHSFDIPALYDSAGQKAVAAIRVLPITEDFLSSPSDQLAAATASANPSLSADEQALQQSQEDEFFRLTRNEAAGGATSGDTPSSTAGAADAFGQACGSQCDFTIESPVFIEGGVARSHMRSFTRSLALTELAGASVTVSSFDPDDPAQAVSLTKLLARSYAIFPYLFARNAGGVLQSVQEMPGFTVYFASPYQIVSRLQPERTLRFGPYTCCFANGLTGDRECFTFHTEVPGLHVTSEESLRIDYLVLERGAPLRAGKLKVRIFDATRNSFQISTAADQMPDFDAELGHCDSPYSLENDRKTVYHRRQPSDIARSYLETVTRPEASYLNGYAGEIEVDVANGRAQFTVPAENAVTAKLRVVAELVFPTDPNQSVAVDDPVWLRSPLSIEFRTESNYTSGLEASPYEIGAFVRYLGEPAPDDITVEFASSQHKRNLGGQQSTLAADSALLSLLGQLASQSTTESERQRNQEAIRTLTTQSGVWPPTPLNPSVSKTTGFGTGEAGLATGVFLGPHGEVQNRLLQTSDYFFEERGDLETLTVRVTYKGFSVSASRVVEWFGKPAAQELRDFHFLLTVYREGQLVPGDTVALYADGWDSVTVVADLPASVETLPEVKNFADFLLGKDENGNAVGPGRPSRVAFTGGGGSALWSEAKPVDAATGFFMGQNAFFDGELNRGWAASRPIRRARVIPPAGPNPEGADPQDPIARCRELNCTQVAALTTATTNEGVFRGEGCADYNSPASGNCLLTTGNFLNLRLEPHPIFIKWLEPLAGIFYSDGKTGLHLVRDGDTRTQVLADVTFSGEPIPFLALRKGLRGADGNPLPMPEVRFDIWKIIEDKDASGKVVARREVRDGTVSMQNATALLALSRTSVHGGDSGHYHECTVDQAGNGRTTRTYRSNSTELIAGHEHVIANFSVGVAVGAQGAVHAHTLRSVAEALVNPIDDLSSDIVVSATMQYDASRTPVTRIL